MRKIIIGSGIHTFVDDEDYEMLSRWTWRFNKGYAVRKDVVDGIRKEMSMVRLIMGLEYGDIRQVDHINRDRLDNRKENLRIVTKQQNDMNRSVQSNNTSGYKGVTYRKKLNRWRSVLTINRKRCYLGAFKSKEDAALAYDYAVYRIHGEYAYLNFPQNERLVSD